MTELTLCMIIKDEESILEATLSTITPLVDETIIVDTGSSDNSIEIAKKYADRVETFDWIDNFSAARNYCQTFATKEFILTWDADSILKAESIKFFQNLKQRDFDNNNLILGSWIVESGDDNKPIKSIAKPLVYKRDLFHWEEPVHNVLVANSADTVVRSKVYPDILFTHGKTKDKHRKRGNQTKKIIERGLKNNREPRLLVYYGELLLKEENLEEAEKIFLEFLEKHSKLEESVFVIEKLLFIYLSTNNPRKALEIVEEYMESFDYHPRFILTLADALAANGISGAENYYLDYLKSPILEDNKNYYYDVERFYIHPRMMLANILINNGNLVDAKKLLNEVIAKTSLHSTKKTANLLLLQISNL